MKSIPHYLIALGLLALSIAVPRFYLAFAIERDTIGFSEVVLVLAFACPILFPPYASVKMFRLTALSETTGLWKPRKSDILYTLGLFLLVFILGCAFIATVTGSGIFFKEAYCSSKNRLIYGVPFLLSAAAIFFFGVYGLTYCALGKERRVDVWKGLLKKPGFVLLCLVFSVPVVFFIFFCLSDCPEPVSASGIFNYKPRNDTAASTKRGISTLVSVVLFLYFFLFPLLLGWVYRKAGGNVNRGAEK